MGYGNGVEFGKLLDEINKTTDAAVEKTRKAGEEAGEEYVEGMIDGIKKRSKAAKSEIAKIYEDFNKTTNNFKSRKSITQAEWTRVLGLSKELMKSERYADSVREKLAGISVTLKNGINVSGLEKVLEEWSKVGGLVESVQWSEAGKNYRKKPPAKKPEVATPVVDADPAPAIKEETKQVDELEQKYRELIQSVQEWKKLATDVKSISAKNSQDLRKQVIGLVSQISADTAHMIGPIFEANFANGFKGIKTKDIMASIMQLDNADLLGHITEQLNVLENIDLKNFNLSEVLKLDSSTSGHFVELYDVLKKIAQIQGQMVSPVKEVTDVIEAQGEVIENVSKKIPKMESVIKKYNKLMNDVGLGSFSIDKFDDEDTSIWTVEDMVKQAQKILDMYYPEGHKKWKSETGKLQEFINTYEPYIGVIKTTVGETLGLTDATERQTAAMREQESAVETIATETKEAIKETEEYIKAQEKLASIQTKLKSGSEAGSFARGHVYSGREGRLTLASRLGTELSRFDLSDDEIDKLVDSTYEQFSKVRKLIVDKQEWDNAIKGQIRNSAFYKQFNQVFDLDVANQLGGVQEFSDIIEQVHDGIIDVSKAMQLTSDLVNKTIKPQQDVSQVLQEQEKAAESAADAMEHLSNESKEAAKASKQVNEEAENVVKLLNDVLFDDQPDPEKLKLSYYGYEQYKKVLESIIEMEQQINGLDSSRDDVRFAKEYLSGRKQQIVNSLHRSFEYGLVVKRDDPAYEKLLSDANNTGDPLKLLAMWTDVKDATANIKKQDQSTKELTSSTEELAQAQKEAAQATKEKLNEDTKKSVLSDEEINHALDVKAKYTGAKLKGKSDFVDAINAEWDRGNKAVAAKLYEQYKTRFADGKYDPSTNKKFGVDWSENYNKYLDQANRHIAELDKRLGNAANGVIELQGEFETFGDIAGEATSKLLTDVDLSPTKFYNVGKYDFTDNDISAAESQLESARAKAQELKDEALIAKEAFDNVSNMRFQYTGKFDGKADLQAAIKDAWKNGNKAVAAKLYEQYQTRFPKGAFDPSTQKMFGDDWVNNHAKYLEQANRHIVELDTILNGMASDYGKYDAYRIVASFVEDKTKMLNEMKQNKLVGEVVKQDLDSRREAARNKYATEDASIANKNLEQVFEEFTRRQLVAKGLFDRKEQMIQAVNNDDDLSNNQLFVGYKNAAQAIGDIARQFADATLDAKRFAVTEMQEAIKIAKILGIEVNDTPIRIGEMEDKVLSEMLMSQKRFAMSNEKAGTPEKSNQIFDAKIEQQNEYQRELAETADAVKQVNDAESNLLYHAGDLSNISNTLKSFPLGNVPPMRGNGIGGLTGLYTTDELDGFIGTEWQGAPISTIDISGYNLLKTGSSELAEKIGGFLNDVNATIYGYYDSIDEKDWELKRHTDVKSIDELYVAHKELFAESGLTIEQFTQFINNAKEKIVGKNFADIELPAIDEGVAKSGISKALQGVTDEVFNSDSFKTQLLKMLGYEGVDLRGTKYNGTYTGGTVIFDVKPESIKSVNEKWSDVMLRNGYEVTEDDLKHEEKRRQLAFETAEAYSKQTEEIKENKKTLNDFMSKFNELSSNSGNKDAFAQRHAHLLEGVSGETPSIDYSVAYDQLIADEEKYQQEVAETKRINTERTQQLQEFILASQSMFSGGMNQAEESVMSDILNKISLDGLSAADAMQELSIRLEELRGQQRQLDVSDDSSVGSELKDTFEVIQQGESVTGKFITTASNVKEALQKMREALPEEQKEWSTYIDSMLTRYDEKSLMSGTKSETASIGNKSEQYKIENLGDGKFAITLSGIRDEAQAASIAVQKFITHVNNLGDEFKGSEHYRDNFNMLVDSIKSGSITAVQAIEKMSDAYEEWNTSLVASDPKEIKDFLDIEVDKSNPLVANAFNGMNINDWIKHSVQPDARDQLKGELYKLAQIIVDGKSNDVYDQQLSRIADFIVENSKHREYKEANPYDEAFRKLLVTYTDEDEADMGEVLFQRAKSILGKKFQKRTDKNKYADSIDQLIDTLIYNGYSSLFSDPGGSESHYNKFRELVDAFAVWKQEGNRKTRDVYLSDADAPGIVNMFNESMLGPMINNIAEQAYILQKRAESAQQAEENLKKVINGVQNVSTHAILTSRTKEGFEDFAQQVANDSGMELGAVSVARNDSNEMTLATIKLINKELAQSITYTYDIRENADGVSEAMLRSSVAVGDVSKALEKMDAKEKKAAQQQLRDNTWLLSQRSKLDTQKRRYTSPDKGIDGGLGIMSPESSLPDNVDHTIENLEKHIREKIKNAFDSGLTDEARQQIISDLGILENEIKVRQQETYSSTTMKSSQVQTNKDAYTEYLRAFKAKAQKTGVFDKMSADIADLESALKAVSDSKGLNAFIDKFKIARNKFQAETAEMSRDAKALQKQLSAFGNEENAYNKLFAKIRAIDTDNIGEDFAQKIYAYQDATVKLQNAMNNLKANPTDPSGRLHKEFEDAALSAKNARVEIEEVFKHSQKLQNMGEIKAVSRDEVDGLRDFKVQMIEFANAAFDGKAKVQGFNATGTEMYVTLDRGADVAEKVTIALDGMSGKLTAVSTGVSKATNEWSDFATQIGQGVKQVAGMYIGFQEAVQAVRTGINYVKEIDLAMTELKKVTDETDASYKEFLNDAGSTSAVIGSTISDFTNATATFARLGYSMNEASSMAETAVVYKNVADGLDTVEEASEAIISTMAAFGIEANDTMSIIDRFNEVGNNFSITSAGIGDALSRSASALYAAGNTIDESVALITAANQVVQNPEQVGTALKTLSLRLRGAKVELEEAGEDVDGMAESTSQLQAKLKALTHGKVDIMLDADTFKSTTQILREMAGAWEDMTDIERASALELMGGGESLPQCTVMCIKVHI